MSTVGRNHQGCPPGSNVRAAEIVASKIQPVRDDYARLLSEMFSDRRCIVSFANAHAVNLACKNREFFNALICADMLLRDGLGVMLLLKAMRMDAGLNMNGTDLIPKILAKSAQGPVALYGSSEEVASAAAAHVSRCYGMPVTSCDGFQSTDHYLERIRVERPRVLVLGMGMPRQEQLANAIAKSVDFPILIINGGAILDFVAGRFRRAPLLLRQLGLEWAFRLYLEPVRLWRRYLLGNIIFLGRAGLAALRNRLIAPLSDRLSRYSIGVAPPTPITDARSVEHSPEGQVD